MAGTNASQMVPYMLKSFWCDSWLPSGKRSHNYGKSPFLMGKSTISMAIFNSYVKLPEGMDQSADQSIDQSLPLIWNDSYPRLAEAQLVHVTNLWFFLWHKNMKWLNWVSDSKLSRNYPLVINLIILYNLPYENSHVGYTTFSEIHHLCVILPVLDPWVIPRMTPATWRAKSESGLAMEVIQPRCSMVLEDLPTFTPKIAQMSVNIPAPWSIWVIYPPWNFLYEMVGLNAQKRYHNDIGIV